MVEQKERLWDFEAVQPGQSGQPTVVAITAENIAGYALVAQNRDARYQRAGANLEYDGELVAMPSMALSCAPLLRDDIAANNGFTALEESRTARRQTPFAKCEIRWSRPVRAGDTITGNRRVLEKYQRRDNKFVTFRVEAVNQRGELVAEYDYTCIFEYAQGQREVPQDRGTAQPVPLEAGSVRDGITTPVLFPTFDSVSLGDQLATLDVSESEAIILRKNEFRLAGEYHASNIHTDGGICPPEHLRRCGQFGAGHHVLRGPDAGPVLPVAGFLQWREAVDAGHYALPVGGIQYPSRAR